MVTKIYSALYFQIHPPRDAPLSWYTTFALKKMKEYGAIYLTPFSHRLAEEIDDPELQRLRCRVNYHALRFRPHIMKLSFDIVDNLRSQGHFLSIHLRFEMDMLAFAGYEVLPYNSIILQIHELASKHFINHYASLHHHASEDST